MQISSVRNVYPQAIKKMNNAPVKSNPIAQNQKQNNNFSFGMAQLSALQRAEIKKRVDERALQNAINDISYSRGSEDYFGSYKDDSLLVIRHLSEDKMSKLFSADDKNIFAVMKNAAASDLLTWGFDEKYILNGLKSLSKMQLSDEQVETLYILIHALKPEQVYEYFSAIDDTCPEGNTTNFQTLVKNSPNAVCSALSTMCYEDRGNLVKGSIEDVCENCSGETIAKLITDNLKDKDLKYDLMQKANFAKYFSSNSNISSSVIRNLPKEILAKYLNNDVSVEELFSLFAKSDELNELFSKLPPEEYPEIYSTIRKVDDETNTKNVTLLSASKTDSVSKLPDNILVKLLKEDEKFSANLDYHKRKALVDRLGTEKYDEIFGQGESEKVSSRIFALSLRDKTKKVLDDFYFNRIEIIRDTINNSGDVYSKETELNKVYSKAFADEYQSYNSDLKAKCLQEYIYFANPEVLTSSKFTEEVERLATNDPDLSVSSSICLLDTFFNAVYIPSKENEPCMQKCMEFKEISDYLKSLE